MLLRKWLRMWWVGWLLNRWCLPVGSNPPCFSHLALLIHCTPFRLHSRLGRTSKPKGYSKTCSDTEHGLSFPELQPSSIQMIIYPEIMDICLLWWWLNGAQICSRTFWGTHQDSIGRAEALCSIACISLPLGLLRSRVPGGQLAQLPECHSY